MVDKGVDRGADDDDEDEIEDLNFTVHFFRRRG